jgi:hypothetical protein
LTVPGGLPQDWRDDSDRYPPREEIVPPRTRRTEEFESGIVRMEIMERRIVGLKTGAVPHRLPLAVSAVSSFVPV